MRWIQESRTLLRTIPANARFFSIAPKSMVCRSQEETEKAGAQLAAALGPKAGDFVMLFGPVGAGKSVFARGFIREAVGDSELKVLSPTFLLEQEYVCKRKADELVIHHFDLYRFSPEMTAIDAKALDWHVSLLNGVNLVEWPERIRRIELLPPRWIEVKLSFSTISDDERIISLESKEK